MKAAIQKELLQRNESLRATTSVRHGSWELQFGIASEGARTHGSAERDQEYGEARRLDKVMMARLASRDTGEGSIIQNG